ncbi:SMP-30/gluconolactonase/LRE family protein [uncultured Sphingomonas sp.]|uniref:SMP-30/gluconolactonase/LRE family protein n=1 Tax=uncultured Sphingomonas sp. TaxID=158754 RepID=UPI0026324CC1|nr:SMP-30/gluconolactonase/LRE family protein [uncultured Sphingomonas sp.]
MSVVIGRRGLLAAGAWLAAAPALALEPPAAVTIRRLSPAADALIAPGSIVETIATGIRWAEGPLWVPGTGLLFSDPPANLMRRWTRAEGTRRFLSPSGAAHTDPALVREPGSNGLALDRKGRLLIANSGGRSIDRLDLKTGRRTVLVDRYRGKRFNSPNDLHVARDGAIYFTDPPYGLADGDTSPIKELAQNGVYRLAPDGGVMLVDGTLTRPNGIARSPDERRLYVSVSDEAAPRIMVYDLDARGMPRRSELWLDAKPLQGAGAPGLPDGMKIRQDGTHFCSVPGGMMVLTPEAEPLGLVVSGSAIANCAIGEHGTILYMTGSDRVFRLPLRHRT